MDIIVIFTFSASTKGKNKIKGYTYVFKYEGKEQITWRCSKPSTSATKLILQSDSLFYHRREQTIRQFANISLQCYSRIPSFITLF